MTRVLLTRRVRNLFSLSLSQVEGVIVKHQKEQEHKIPSTLPYTILLKKAFLTDEVYYTNAVTGKQFAFNFVREKPF